MAIFSILSFHHRTQLSSSVTENQWFRPPATPTQLTRLSPNCSSSTRHAKIYPVCLDSWSLWPARYLLTDHQAKLGAAETHPNYSLDAATQRALVCHYHCSPSHPTRAAEGGVHGKHRLSAVVITQLFDAGSIWWEYRRIPSADCVVRKSNLQNTYGYNVRRSWWNDTIATLDIRWVNSPALHAQL